MAMRLMTISLFFLDVIRVITFRKFRMIYKALGSQARSVYGDIQVVTKWMARAGSPKFGTEYFHN